MTDEEFLEYQQLSQTFCECESLSFYYIFCFKTEAERDAAMVLFELRGINIRTRTNGSRMYKLYPWVFSVWKDKPSNLFLGKK